MTKPHDSAHEPESDPLSGFKQRAIQRPEFSIPESRRAQQVNIHPPQAASHQPVRLEDMVDLAVLRHLQQRQLAEQIKNLASGPEVAAGKLTDHECVARNNLFVECLAQRAVSPAKAIYPDRGIDELHFLFAGAVRRRGVDRNAGWLPPSTASRRALSRYQRRAYRTDMPAPRTDWTGLMRNG